MPLFGRKPEASDDAPVGDAAQSPQDGPTAEPLSPQPAPTGTEVPEAGRERLERMKDAARKGFFTSDLSVDEFLLTREAGFEPLGLVLGSSIYHIGFQFTGLRASQEVQVLSQALYNARELAMDRMETEADELGADGIVGVRLTINRYIEGDIAEFLAVGTAIRHRGGESHRTPGGKPFTSELSGQDFWKLLRAGHRPLGMVMGSCVYHVAHQSMRQALKQAGQNLEMPNYTQAIYDARELAMGRMQAEAEGVGAEGIVGVRVSEFGHWGGEHVIEYLALGTAVVPAGVDHELAAPTTVVSFDGQGAISGSR